MGIDRAIGIIRFFGHLPPPPSLFLSFQFTTNQPNDVCMFCVGNGCWFQFQWMILLRTAYSDGMTRNCNTILLEFECSLDAFHLCQSFKMHWNIMPHNKHGATAKHIHRHCWYYRISFCTVHRLHSLCRIEIPVQFNGYNAISEYFEYIRNMHTFFVLIKSSRQELIVRDSHFVRICVFCANN